MHRLATALVVGLLLSACGDPAAPSGPAAIRLVDRFASAEVRGTPPVSDELPPSTSWRFDGPPPAADDDGAPADTSADDPTDPAPPAVDAPDDAPDDAADDAHPLFELADGAAPPVAVHGWHALSGVEDLAVRDGRLVGTVGEMPILHTVRPEGMEEDDLLHAVEVRLRVPSGGKLGFLFDDAERLELERFLARAEDSSRGALTVDLQPGDEVRTYTLTTADSSFLPSIPVADVHHVMLRVWDVEPGDELALESVRLVSRREHLATIPSGVSWQPCSEIYREAIVARSPEEVLLTVDLPAEPWLDLELGTVEEGPATFRVDLRLGGTDAPVDRTLLLRTLTTSGRWEPVTIDLAPWAGQRVTLGLALAAESSGAIGLWGSPVVRSRGAAPDLGAPSPSRAALGGPDAPRGVILIVTDTLRRDHLDAWGYERETAPVLTRLAAEGARFADNISQGAWTKVSVGSILTSLYPSTHGMVDTPDRLPASVQTLAECFRDAGYATFATSSVPFTGKLSNLHQGLEVMHERSSLEGDVGSKTARPFVDRFLDWLGRHHDVPFYARLHVFDPHSPFEPRRPWDTRWAEPGAKAAHEERVEQAREVMEESARKARGLPWLTELQEAGVDPDAFTRTEKDWYDASIRAMDAEIGRVMERLEEYGLADRVVVAVVADHGEEFLEHGRHWHGDTVYGEMTNVPMIVRWPGVVPPTVVEETTQSLDLAPTLLDLCRLPVPERAQGRSLLPLLASPDDPAALGWRPQPAFSEVRLAEDRVPDPAEDWESFSIVNGRWRLVRHVIRPEGRAEFELYDHGADPLNLEDVADEHPEVVERLAAELERWKSSAEAQRVEGDDLADLSEADLEQLRALGYVK